MATLSTINWANRVHFGLSGPKKSIQKPDEMRERVVWGPYICQLVICGMWEPFGNTGGTQHEEKLEKVKIQGGPGEERKKGLKFRTRFGQ